MELGLALDGPFESDWFEFGPKYDVMLARKR
jgi:ATP-dependent helicase/DNAse subunit B